MDKISLAIAVLGGLAFFLYGMNLMSEGLTQIAGARLKAVLGYVTKNRFAAIFAGAGVTAVIQSSSATTVMTVGFVNAGLLSLQQAIGVIFGANIGTTVTGQLVSFKLTDVAIPSIILGVVGLMIAKRARMRGIWQTILGFGLLFFGMNIMSTELKVLAEHPSFVRVFSLFDCTPSASGFLPPLSVLGAIAVGTLCTMLVQSSSATIGITIALTEAGIINIWTAVPIVLGDNIGTTITAALAAIGTNANARRAALAHALFNVLGTLILVATFPFVFGSAAGHAPAFFQLVNACTEGNALAGENPGRFVAMAHTLFNVTNVCILTAFIPLLARLCERIIRDEQGSRAQILEPHLLVAPSVALEATARALADMTRRAWTISSVALNCCLGKAAVELDTIENAEKTIDDLQRQIRDYLVSLSQRKLTDREARQIPELLHCVNDAERISDLALKVYRKTDRIKNGELPPAVIQDALAVTAMVRAFAHQTITALRTGTPLAENADAQERRIHEAARLATRTFTANLHVGGDHAKATLAILSVFNCLRDVTRHIGNIATRIAD